MMSKPLYSSFPNICTTESIAELPKMQILCIFLPIPFSVGQTCDSFLTRVQWRWGIALMTHDVEGNFPLTSTVSPLLDLRREAATVGAFLIKRLICLATEGGLLPVVCKKVNPAKRFSFEVKTQNWTTTWF
jgi:hypothetical protein